MVTRLELPAIGTKSNEVFDKADEFDRDTIYNYIWDTAEGEVDDDSKFLMAKNLLIFRNVGAREMWQEKWDQYLEVNQ